MWYPRSWAEMDAVLGQAAESPVLDFKKRFTSNDETAKDIAARTLNGGVLIYGVDEDKETRVATEITTVQLGGAEEKLRQIAGSRVAPSPDLDVIVLTENPADTTGVVIVVIPASPLAPHQANHRYPSRQGTITAYLEERDVERLYRQREELASAPSVGDLLGDFVPAPGPLDAPDGVGRLDLVVRPAAQSARHPGGAWQRQHLEDAVRAAGARQSRRFNNLAAIQMFDQIGQWRAWAAAGWTAGDLSSAQQHPYYPAVRLAATLTYPARLSFQGRLGLIVRDTGGQPLYRSAREQTMAGELMSMLAIAGEYFMGIPGAGILFVALRLTGFDDAKSEATTRSQQEGVFPGPGSAFSGAPGAPDGITAEKRAAAIDIRDEPELTTNELIEPWLPAFAGGPLVLAWLSPAR